jgi:mannan endo-1,4-beta-mannosidase
VFRSSFVALCLLPLLGACAGVDTASEAPAAEQSVVNTSGNQFVKQNGARLALNGKEFRAVGTNVYYLGYKSPQMVDDVLERAAAQGANVVRTWAAYETGKLDGTMSTFGKADGVVYYQYWDGTAPAYNDGPDGLERLDYAVYKAGQLGIRLVLPLVNNWNAFGGMDQYVRWAGGQYHDEFYTNPTIKGWYKNWVSHLLNRTNKFTGVAYKNDPTILSFELANEPRCKGSGAYPASPSCNTQTLISWADEMSQYINSIASKHLLAVGDEGFYCIPGATDWTENCSEGVDTVAFAKLPQIDFLSFHMYPDHWEKDAAWGKQWIARHIADAKKANKPILLDEFGLKDKNVRNPVYKEWTDTVLTSGGSGALYWMLAGEQDDGSLYGDYDGFTVYCPGAVCSTLGNFFASMKAGQALVFDPVADSESVIVEHDTAATLNVVANDIAYGGATINAATVDLNPATAAVDTQVTVPGGSIQALNGVVTVTPDFGYAGDLSVSYVVKDSAGKLSNPAQITVTVKADPNAIKHIHGFESSTEGWAVASWAGPATTSVSSDWASVGASSLKVEPTGGQWFQTSYSWDAPLNLTGKRFLKWDLRTTGNGTSQQMVLKDGDTWSWCEAGGWTWFGENQVNTVTIDLNTLSCSVNLANIREMYIFMGNGGTAPIYIDDIRAE